MSTLRAVAVAAVAAVTFTGCIPQLVGPGFKQARHPNTRTLRVAPIPLVDDAVVLAPWNRTAGRTLFAPTDDKRPHVRFHRMTPICARGNCNDRRAAWVERTRRPDGSVYRCIIHWDPELAHTLDHWTWAHELGHCLDLPDVPHTDPYRGVMSYYGFNNWRGRQHWWGAADREMLRQAGYRSSR